MLENLEIKIYFDAERLHEYFWSNNNKRMNSRLVEVVVRSIDDFSFYTGENKQKKIKKKKELSKLYDIFVNAFYVRFACTLKCSSDIVNLLEMYVEINKK